MLYISVGDYSSRVMNIDYDSYKKLRDYFRIKTDYWAMKNNPRLPPYSYFITEKGYFLSGLWPRMRKVLAGLEIPYEVKDVRTVKEPPPTKEVKVALDGLRVEGKKLNLRDYQMDSLSKGLLKTRGVFSLCTGAGKTVVMSALISAWYKKTLVVINSKDLAEQLRDEISEFICEEVGFIGSGIWNPKRVTVAIDKSLVGSRSPRKKQRAKEYMKEVEYLVFDEVHHLQSSTWQKISRACKNAQLRHGFTGTPETTVYKSHDGEANKNIIIEAHIGSIIHNVHVQDLIELGYLSKLRVQMVKNEVYYDNADMSYGEDYDRLIVKDEQRNRIITQIINRNWKQGRQVIGFVDRIAHGEILKHSLINDYGIPENDVEFAHGEAYDRGDMIDGFKSGQLPILLGTVLKEGLNFFAHEAVNCAGGKSSKNIRQKAGRILRKPRTETGDVDTELEREVLLTDFCDNGNPIFRRHGKKRIETYEVDGHPVSFVDPEEIL